MAYACGMLMAMGPQDHKSFTAMSLHSLLGGLASLPVASTRVQQYKGFSSGLLKPTYHFVNRLK